MARRDLSPSRHVHATITERGGMLLDVRGRGRWYVLTPPGARWWHYLAEGASPDEAADRVAAYHGVPADTVRDDMRRLGRQLADRGLLKTNTSRRKRWRP